MAKQAWLDAGETCPPPGRELLTLQEAGYFFVEHPAFAETETRQGIWEGFNAYLTLFLELQERYDEVLEERQIVTRCWLGGSFVSAKINPRNIDASVFVSAEVRDILKGRPGTAWLNTAFERNRMLEQFKVSPLEVPYVQVASPFQAHKLTNSEQKYFRERGAWDDWWQRMRDPETLDLPPSIETCAPRRGYVEVTL